MTSNASSASLHASPSVRTTPVHFSTVVTAPPWAKDEPPSPTDEAFSDGHNAIESRRSVTSFSTHASNNEPSRWNTFTRPRDKKSVSFRDRSISWLPTQRDGSTSFPRRSRQNSRTGGLNRNWNLSITLPTPPVPASTAYTLQHNATPGWDAPWTSRVGAQGPAGRHHSDSSVEEESSPANSEKAGHHRRKRLRAFILSNAYVPLIFRLINIAFTTAALAIAIRIRNLEKRLHTMGELGSSPTLVIIFAPPTLLHVMFSIYLEYFGRPLGLWRTSHKLAYTLSEVLFICAWSAALSLCFDNFFTSVIPWPQRSVSRSRSRLRGISRLRATRDYAVGIGLLLVVVILWTSSNFVTQGMYTGGYEKPFLVTYLNTASFALYLIPVWVRRRWKRDGESRTPYQPLAVDGEAQTNSPDPSSPEETLPPLTSQETTRLALLFCFLWFVANWTLNASLDYTSVASATILSSMSGFFTLGIGRVFRVETLTIPKIFAVVTSFAGVILVSLSDSIQPQQPAGAASRPLAHIEDLAPRPIWGDALALVSAIFYACYVILLKVRIRSESRIDMQQFFGYVGLFNILLCWPIALLLHVTGIETIQLPSRDATAALLINMGITLTSDFIYVLAMLKTTPLVVTVGLSLTIPLAVIGDFLLSKFTRGQVIFGAILVLVSFVVVGLDNEKIKPREDAEPAAEDEEEDEDEDIRPLAVELDDTP
ncbi:hypothetical protein MIND_00495100 [Mycena indigotica]|uniref:EamA domain-containing protein n=1 Tax=Mycena indigotica TaxID=2126181 RepID=A0A8H6W8K6_9AGAR|nr:uncharacterized protein MIND_00495100 [Mycena indigotica]KAF7307021.1 hypothetical protein MIND_00495100 [Mycena indigotica]